MDVWHSILELPIKGAWLALNKTSLLSSFGAVDKDLLGKRPYQACDIQGDLKYNDLRLIVCLFAVL